MEKVLKATRWVTENASHVKINSKAIQKAVELFLKKKPITQNFWSTEIHFFDGTEETVRWIFLLDTLNHCFWPDPGNPPWAVFHNNKEYSGYEGLAVSLKRAIEEGIPLTDPDFLITLNENMLAHIFRGRGMIPMLRHRTENLKEVGRVLKEQWRGDVVNIVEAASQSAKSLVEKIVTYFNSFKDEANYKGKTVYFWKRAQLFVSDLYIAFNGTKWGEFKDIQCLTAFADYKLPQVLRHLGILEYDQELEHKIESKIILPSGSKEEVEIRAATVQAVELIKNALQKRKIPCNSALIDNWLWSLGQEKEFRKKPYHLCRTIFY